MDTSVARSRCVAALLVAGCGANAAESAPSRRDSRYCEVIPVYMAGAVLTADVWNTEGLGDCPQAEWDALDAAALATELGATLVLLNGPRAFLMDEVTAVLDDPPTRSFGALDMRLVATLDIDPAMAGMAPYQERAINRQTRFEFFAGSEVYELIDPAGRRYVMQSYAMFVDKSLREPDLAALGERLEVPAGWRFEVTTLDAPLVVETEAGTAHVVQDELSNTYQLQP